MAGRHQRWAAGMVALALALAGTACGSDDNKTASTTTSAAKGASTSSATAAEAGFPAARCEANKKAGKILFLTSFDYAAAASIIDVVVAAEKGWFQAVCLDVELQAGFSTANVATVAANKAQMTSLGSFSEVAVANSQDAGLVAVAVEGKTSVEELLVENGKGISKLTDLTGHSVGIKGAIPYSIRAMLAKAGVDEKGLKQIEVGFNPITLFETEIDALPVYKSNEPGQLDAAGYQGKYTVFDPAKDDIPASFAVFTTSRGFADKNPTAVADFLRAALKGFEWAAANPADAVALTLKRSDPKLFFSPDGEKFRWATEAKLVKDSTPAGQAVGAIDKARLDAEMKYLEDLKVIPAGKVDVAKSIDAKFVNEVTKDGKVVWYG